MSERKLITISIDEESINAFHDYLSEDINEEQVECSLKRIWDVYNELSVAYENSTTKIQSPKNMDEAKEIIEMQQRKITELQDNNIDFALRSFMALEAILDHDPAYSIHQPQVINVYDEEFDIFRAMTFVAKDIVCIQTSTENKGREKHIYVRIENTDGSIAYKRYKLNDNDLPFEKLCELFDNTSNYLIRVSKSAIVNVAYYNLSEDFVHLTIESQNIDEIGTIKISDKKSKYETYKSDFIKAKEFYRRYILSQKRIIGYLNSSPLSNH